jgi:hypothetical protein
MKKRSEPARPVAAMIGRETSKPIFTVSTFQPSSVGLTLELTR